jgi:hypothetical protein
MDFTGDYKIVRNAISFARNALGVMQINVAIVLQIRKDFFPIILAVANLSILTRIMSVKVTNFLYY